VTADLETVAPVSHRALFATGVLLGLLSEQMLAFAVPLLIYQHTDSLAALGLAFAVEWLPALIAYPFAGLLADRDGGRRLFRRSNALRGLVLASAASVVLLAPSATTVVLMTSGALLSTLSAPVRMCIEKLVPQLAPGRKLAATQALVQNMELLAMALGPGLAVLGATLLGKVWLLGVASAVFALAGAAWTPLPRRSPRDLALTEDSGSGAVLRELRLGLSMLRGIRPVVLLAALNFTINLTLAVVLSVNAAMITSIFNAPESVLALLNACVGVTGLINLLLAPVLLRWVGVEALGVAGFTVICVACLTLGAAPSVLLYGAAYVAALAGTAVFNIYNRTQRVQVIPREHLGKVMGPFYLANLLSLPIGGLLVALVGAAVGPQGLVAGLAVGLIVVGAVLLPLTVLSFRRALARLTTPERAVA
jgi:MFS family permease